jgi:hypothetical protein
MSDSSERTIRVVLELDRDEMARRGRLGGFATHARHDSEQITRSARSAFLARFSSDQERRAYFADLGRRSAAARRVASEGGAK